MSQAAAGEKEPQPEELQPQEPQATDVAHQRTCEHAEAIARRYEHRVRYFVHKVSRLYGMGTRWNDELRSAGYFGLAKAVLNRRADATEFELSAYVSRRILGAVIDEARAIMRRSGEVVTPGFAGVDEVEGGALRICPVDPKQTPEEAANLRWQRDRIEDALAVLDAQQRSVVEAYMHGDSVRDIALREGIAESTLHARFQKTLRLLRGRAPEILGLLRDAV